MASGHAREALGLELRELVSQVNSELDPHEQLEFAVVVKEPWTTDNGFLTPTMKIRRSIIEERYEPQIERWFQTPNPDLPFREDPERALSPREWLTLGYPPGEVATLAHEAMNVRRSSVHG